MTYRPFKGWKPGRKTAVRWPALKLQQAGEAGQQHQRSRHRPPQAQALPADCRGKQPWYAVTDLPPVLLIFLTIFTIYASPQKSKKKYAIKNTFIEV